MKKFALILGLIALPLFAAEQPLRNLDKIEAALKSTPDDPMLHYRKCQALFAKGKEQEAIDHASVALSKFKAAQKDLAWMGLGSIKTAKYNVQVHYNMGPKERAEKKDGLVRPYSFRVWTTDAQPKLVRILDFELVYLDGELRSAAVGETIKGRRSIFGTVDPKSDFAAVKRNIMQIVINGSRSSN